MKKCENPLCKINCYPVFDLAPPKSKLFSNWKKEGYIPEIENPEKLLTMQDFELRNLKGTYYCPECFNGRISRLDDFYTKILSQEVVKIKCASCKESKEIPDKAPYECPDCYATLKRPFQTIEEKIEEDELEEGDCIDVDNYGDGKFQCIACGEEVELNLDDGEHYTEDETNTECPNCGEEYKVFGHVEWSFSITKKV